MKKKEIIISMVILLTIISCEQNKKTESVSAKPIPSFALNDVTDLEKESAQVTSTTDGESSEVHRSNPQLENAIIVRKEYLMPVLEGIWSTPVKCTQLIDDPLALTDLNSASEKQQVNSKQDADDSKNDMDACLNLAESEKMLRERMQGQLKALASIQQKYPCSEAASIALLEMINSIWRPDILSKCGGHRILEDEKVKLENYIIDNYPDTWEAERAKFWRDTVKSKGLPDKIVLLEQSIRYAETNNLQNNKYFILWNNRVGGPQYDPIATSYEVLISNYFWLGGGLGRDSIQKTGHLSDEAIDYCKKGFEIFAELKKKYPNYTKSEFPGNGRVCHNMINRLDNYKDK